MKFKIGDPLGDFDDSQPSYEDQLTEARSAILQAWLRGDVREAQRLAQGAKWLLVIEAVNVLLQTTNQKPKLDSDPELDPDKLPEPESPNTDPIKPDNGVKIGTNLGRLLKEANRHKPN